MLSNVIDTTSFEIVTYHPPNPGLGAGYLFTVPDRTVIQPIGVNVILDTDATVINRRVSVQGGPPGIIWGMSACGTVQTATLNISYWFTINQTDPFYDAAGVHGQCNLTPDMYLYPGDFLQIIAANLQAGDWLHAIYWAYKRWILQ